MGRSARCVVPSGLTVIEAPESGGVGAVREPPLLPSLREEDPTHSEFLSFFVWRYTKLARNGIGSLLARC